MTSLDEATKPPTTAGFTQGPGDQINLLHLKCSGSLPFSPITPVAWASSIMIRRRTVGDFLMAGKW